MAQITGGQVSYLRRVKTGEYEHKEFGCVLTFNVEEGEDHRHVFDTAANAAWAKTENVIRAQIDAPPAINGVAHDATKPRTPKARGAASVIREAAAQQASGPAPAPAADPAAVTEEEALPPATQAAPAPANDPAAVVEEDLTTGTAQEITDATMLHEVQQTNAKIKNAVAIKKLIGKYATALNAIPLDKRPAFLEELARL